MSVDYQFPYVKVIRETGEIVQPADHNRAEIQLECLTDAIGDYDFGAGTVESRITNIDVRVTTLETNPAISVLNDLTDVNTAGAVAGKALVFSAGNIWVPGDIATSLTDLTDTDLTSTPPQAGDDLNYNGTDWVPVGLTVASDADGAPGEVEVPRVTTIRFLGDVGPGGDQVVNDVGNNTVFIGGAAPPGLLSTISGLPTLFTGRMSVFGGTVFPPTLIAGDSYSRLTQATSYTFTTAGSEFGEASLGNLILAVNGVDVANIDLAANFLEVNRASGQVIGGYNTQGTGDPIAAGVVSFVGGSLAITSVAPAAPGTIVTDNYQQGAATITLMAAALQTGYNSVQLRHVAGVTSTSNLLEWFFDIDPPGGATDPGAPASVDITEDTPVIKFISGINYYNTGSTFDGQVGATARLFNNVYHDSRAPITLAFDTFFGGTVSPLITDASVGGVSNPAVVGETMTITNYPITLAAGAEALGGSLTATPRDPYGSYTTNMVTKMFRLMSEGPNSTDVFDDFTDERYRLPNTTNFDIVVPGMPGPPLVWDSTISLLAGARANELQVYDILSSPFNQLSWPDFDPTGHDGPAGAPNYSGLGGSNRTYYRVFRSTSGSKTNGIITLPGITDADIAGGTFADIGLRIKVPTKTVWLDLTVAFNGATFPTGAPLAGGMDGEGCRINAGVNSPSINGSIEFSLGTIGTDIGSDFQLILEITYANSTVTSITGAGAGLSINW